MAWDLRSLVFASFQVWGGGVQGFGVLKVHGLFWDCGLTCLFGYLLMPSKVWECTHPESTFRQKQQCEGYSSA